MNITHKYTRTIVTAVASVLVVIATVGAWVYFQPISRAADLSKFDPGNIMSDSVMSDKSTMSVQQIQNFLNSKNACNNTNTHMAAWYPHLQYTIRDGRFVCMAQDTFNGESAAQIIWQAAQDFSINPQVLIVLLEKEQGLISDTWPNHVQYRTATGFGCPDTAPCESQYFGLKNQIRLAASMFRTVLNGGWSNYPVGQTYVQYHPNAACGGSIVSIQNRATSALYRYTPYQPNQSALNAGYGMGDSCGAYGNRNFYALFTDWFESTQDQYFTAMDGPRQLYTTSKTIKIDPATGQKTEDLPAGLVIDFQQKALFDGKVCLRTSTDTLLLKRMCVLEQNLSEMFTSMSVPRKLITRHATIKIDPATGQKTEDLPAGLVIDFVQLNNVPKNGLCLRTKTDQALGKQMCIVYENLIETYDVFSEMDEPRSLQVGLDTNKINPITGYPIDKQTVVSRQTINFSSKSTDIEGRLCLRTELNTKADDNMCILYEELNEITSSKPPLYSSMDVPRALVTNKSTLKIDAISGLRYDPLPPGLIIDFAMKTYIQNDLCLRTKTDMLLQKNSCVLYSDLNEL